MDIAVRFLVAAFALLLLGSNAYAELQLTPYLRSYQNDGATTSRLAFADGDLEITYTPPTAWDFSGNAAKLTLHPKDKAQAEASIAKSPIEQAVPFDEATQKKLADESLASAPPGSTDIHLLSQELNPVFIGEKETFLVTMSYTFYGETYGRSLMFMNRGKEQLRFQLISRLPDFKELQQAFLGSHFSWQNL